MTISGKSWIDYIARLRKVNEAAADKMSLYLYTHDVSTDVGYRELLAYAHGLTTKYGEAAAALACEMYDAAAAQSGMALPAAEPAPTATYREVSKAVTGTLKSGNPKLVSDSVARLVKRAGADTMLKNAKRDRAQFAWVPHGDTCAFCLTLASRGWQYMSEKALKNGHAEHIHANCDCTYAVRFDDKSGVAGYDPEEYRAMYEGADGATPQEKINAMRRASYAENREKINAQKRLAYKSRMDRERAAALHYTDVLGEWRASATPGSHTVKDLLTYIAPDGSAHTVHGNAVVLDYKPHEKEIAELLERELGGEIFMVPRVNDPPGVRTPDYLFRGKAYDLKTLQPGAGGNTIYNRVKKASGQSKNIILDVSASGLDDETVAQQIETVFWSNNTQFVDEVIVVKDGKVVSINKRKAKE